MKKFLSSTLFKLLVSLAILAFMIHMMDSREVLSAIRQCSPRWLVLGLGALLASNLVAAHQWFLLLRAQEIDIGWFKAQGLYQIGIYFNNFLPGSVGGDVVKIFRLAKYYKRGQAAFAATFMDRFVGFFLLLLFSLAGIVYLYYVLAGEGFTIQGRRMIFFIGQVAFLYILLVAVFFSRRLFNLVIKYLVRPLGWKRLTETAVNMMESIQLYRARPFLLLKLVGISAVVQFLRIWVHYACGIGLGIRTHFTYYLIIVPILALSAVAPITFGGLGLREVTGAEMFKHVGVDFRLAFVMEGLATALGILASLLGGVIYVFLKAPANAGESTHD